MGKIKDIEYKVKMVLENYADAREDDFTLIQRFKDTFFMWNSWKDVFNRHNDLGFPSFETITRCRRKLQEVYPHLQAKKVVELRAKMEQQFEKYALSKNA